MGVRPEDLVISSEGHGLAVVADVVEELEARLRGQRRVALGLAEQVEVGAHRGRAAHDRGIVLDLPGHHDAAPGHEHGHGHDHGD